MPTVSLQSLFTKYVKLHSADFSCIAICSALSVTWLTIPGVEGKGLYCTCGFPIFRAWARAQSFVSFNMSVL